MKLAVHRRHGDWLRLTAALGFALALVLPACPAEGKRECEKSEQCREGEICHEGFCHVACPTAETSCPDDLVCQHGMCLPAVVSGADAGRVDAWSVDLERVDGWSGDAGMTDAGGADAGGTDAGGADAGGADAGGTEAGMTEAGMTEVGMPDIAMPDTLLPDTLVPDACVPPPGPEWWDLSYAERFAITLDAAPSAYTMELSLSGAEAADLHAASLANGEDIRIVYHAPSTVDLDRELLVFSDTSIIIRFMTQPSGSAGGGEAYYLYVGNPQPAAPRADLRAVYLFYEDFEGFDLSDDGSPTFIPRPSGSWQVIDDGGNKVYHLDAAERYSAELADIAPQDGVMEVRAKYISTVGAGTVGVAYRGTDLNPAATTSYVAIIYGSPDEAGVGTFSDATWDGFINWSSFDWAIGSWYDLSVAFVGTTSSLAIDGVEQGAITNTSADHNLLGLIGYAVDVYFDDIKLRKLVDPAPAATLGQVQRPCG